MAHNNLSLKKANMISSARKSANHLLYDYYEVIEKFITENKLQAQNIWNCDELISV